MVPVRLSCVLLAVCGMLFSGHVPASGRDGGKGLPFSYVWERVQMDGSRTGVVCPSAGDVPESLGRMDGRIYVSPSGQVFGPGIVADVAGVVTDAQTVMAPVKKVVGYSPVAMKAEYPESALSNLFVDRVMDAVGEVSGRKVDVGIVNFGGIRVDMPEGDVMVDDIRSMFPFRNDLVYLAMKGSDVRAVLDFMAKDGFQVLGGVRVVAKDGKIVSAEVGGRPLDDDAVYGVATISFLLYGGDGLYLAENAVEMVDTSVEIYDAMLKLIEEDTAAGKRITGRADGRVVILDGGD